MKKISKIFAVSLLAMLLVSLSLISAFATVNGEEAPVGSTVEYTLSIADAEQNIAGIHFEIFFDQDVLSLKEVNTDNLGDSTIVNDNQNGDGTIKVVNGYINGAEGLACSEKTELVKVTFEVLIDGNTQIKYYIPYMYDYDMVNLYKYTLTQTVTVDGEVVIENEPPVLADDTDFAAVEEFDKGDFENNEEGTGDGIVIEPTTMKQVAAGTGTAKADTSDDADENNNNFTIIIAGVCVAVIIGAIVVLVVAKSKANKSAAEEQDDWE